MTTISQTATSRPITWFIRGAEIHAELNVPAGAEGLVLVAYPSSAGRASPRNQHVVTILNDAKLATLFCDLFTPEEDVLGEMTGEYKHDANLLAQRLVTVAEWTRAQADLKSLPLGILGLGDGSCAALIAAAERPEFRALVVRGGRLEVAWPYLAKVTTPVLLVVGENDAAQREAFAVCMPRLASVEKELVVVPRAGPLFKEPTTLDQFAEHAAAWFARHLAPTDAELAGWGWELC